VLPAKLVPTNSSTAGPRRSKGSKTLEVSERTGVAGAFERSSAASGLSPAKD